MTSENTPSPPPSFGKRLGIALSAFLRALLRLFVILFFLAILGAGIYFLPQLYQQYIGSLRDSVVNLENTQVSQEQVNQQLAEQVEELQNRINDLEIRLDSEKQAFSELSARSNEAISTQNAIQEAILTSEATLNERFTEIDDSITELDHKLTSLASFLSQIDSDVEQLEEQVDGLQERFLSEDAPIAALRRELQIVKAMELLTRSRLFLAENNLGLAEDDIRAARDLLANIPVPGYQVEPLGAIIARLELALSNLPDAPVLAADDLEIAWQLLKQGLPGEPPLPTGTTAATGTQTTTLTPQVTMTPIADTPTPTTSSTP